MENRRTLADRAAAWLDERFEVLPGLQKFLNKPVPIHATRLPFCLGGVTFFFFFVQVVTGILLTFYYRPTTAEAYDSILFIMNNVTFGWLIRSIHIWAANLMIVSVILHMLRVYVYGAYKKPRELNWMAGVLLLVSTLGLGFTGYLLPWDQLAYWATTVGTEIAGSVPLIGQPIMLLLRGGEGITDLTLTRFYGIHVIVLPLAIILLLGLHFVMIRRQGISGPL